MADLEWKFAKASQACCLCQGSLNPGQPYYSALFMEATGKMFSRRDYCVRCFQGGPPPDVFYFWRAAQPERERKDHDARRRPAVDLEYVLEFFKRLEERETLAEQDGMALSADSGTRAQRLVFRYVLALMLARKKVLVLEGKKAGSGGSEVHIFREKRGGQKHEVREPALSPEAIAAASAELGTLLGVTPPPAPVQVEQAVSLPAPSQAGQPAPQQVAPEDTARRTSG